MWRKVSGFLYNNVSDSASFFAYKNLTQIALFLFMKCPPPLRQFQKLHEKPCNAKYQAFYTVRMKWIAHFAVDILLLHHYKSNLAHLSYLYSLVIGLYKSEI